MWRRSGSANFRSAFLHLDVEFVALLEKFVFGAQVGFLVEVVRLLAGLGDDVVGLGQGVRVEGLAAGPASAVAHETNTDA